MKKLYEYDLVRRMFFNDGLSRHEISRCTGLHRKTVSKMLLYASPPGYRLAKPRPKPKLNPFLPIIDQILESDSQAPKKQRHTAKRIFDRLKQEHGFNGGYTIVKDYVREKRLRLKEVYFPLEQKPGTSQIDFGQAKVVIEGKERTAYMFCMVLSYSDAVFVKAYQTEAIEAVQDGHNSAYEFLEGVPPLNLYDNMSTAVKKIFKAKMSAAGKKRDLTDDFIALRSHYLFLSCFCNVGRANEKGVVEGIVGYVRRNFFVPVPRFNSWEELNSYLLDQCRKRLSTTVSGKAKTIGELLEQERSTFRQLPSEPFDACRKEERRVTSLSLVHFKTNSYSVPVEYAYREVTVKAYVDKVKICHKALVIAIHERCYQKDEFIFDPRHYLRLLERKPGGLDGALPFSSWELPECFATLRRYLEARNGNPGKREYIKILQLLRDFGITEVKKAIEKAFEYNAVNFESINMLIMSGKDPLFEAVRLSEQRLAALPVINIKSVDASCYQTLLTGERL